MFIMLQNSGRFSRTLSQTLPFTVKKKTSKVDTTSSSSSSDSSSGSESDEKPMKSVTSRKIPDQQVINRLNELLLQIPSKQQSEPSILNLAKPTSKRTIAKEKVKENINSKETLETQTLKAASDIANLIGGDDVKQTESELLSRLLTLKKSEKSSTSSTSVSDIIKGMKIDREPRITEDQSRASQVRQLLEYKKSNRDLKSRRPYPKSDRFLKQITFTPIDLFGHEPLGIFTNKSNLKESPSLSTWKQVHDSQLKLAVTHPPANYFQQMILWTKQGKLWKFPVDNEYGLDEESRSDFTEHIFLEDNLESWCPQKGPIRHFMELVCHGLSKNYHLTVAAKREHIEWYRDYFESKRSLLEEIGAYPVSQSVENVVDSKKD